MYSFLLKNGTAIAMGVGTLITLIFIGTSISGLSSAGYDMGTDLVSVDYKNINAFNTGIYLACLLSAIAVIIMLIAVVLDLWSNRKTSMKMIIGMVVMAVVFFALYQTAAFETGGKWDELNTEFGVTEGASKFITSGIIGCGILGGISVLAIVVAEVRNFFK
jgi:hypothetical protein